MPPSLRFIFYTCREEQQVDILIELECGQKISLLSPGAAMPVFYPTIYQLAKIRAIDLIGEPEAFSAGYIFKDLLFEKVYPSTKVPDNHQRINQHLSRFSKHVKAILTQHHINLERVFHQNRIVDEESQVRFSPDLISIYINNRLGFDTLTMVKKNKGNLKQSKSIYQKKDNHPLIYKNKGLYLGSAMASCMLFAGLFIYFDSEHIFNQSSSSILTSTIEATPVKLNSFATHLVNPSQGIIAEKALSLPLSNIKSKKEVEIDDELYLEKHQALIELYYETGDVSYIEELRQATEELPEKLNNSEIFLGSKLLVAIVNSRMDDAQYYLDKIIHLELFTAHKRDLFSAVLAEKNGNWQRIVTLFEGHNYLTDEQSILLKSAFLALGDYDEIEKLNELQLASMQNQEQVKNDSVNIEVNLFNDPPSETLEKAINTQANLVLIQANRAINTLSTLDFDNYHSTEALLILQKIDLNVIKVVLSSSDFEKMNKKISLLIQRAYLKSNQLELLEIHINKELEKIDLPIINSDL
jgi:hypothetical protein